MVIYVYLLMEGGDSMFTFDKRYKKCPHCGTEMKEDKGDWSSGRYCPNSDCNYTEAKGNG